MPVSAEQAMARAVALAANGFPAPNPRVGCVVVRDGEVVGEGWHDHAGGPHAERSALEQAGERARGADVFVTLEPCRHHGRTPPCTDALIEAGVASVTFAVADPNPTAAKGREVLESAGITVHSGLLENEATAVNRRWLLAQRLGRPVVVVKAATTLDGKIARPDGTSQWISNDASREDAHRFRAELGSVLVGRATVEADNPRLTARIKGVVNQPQRVLLDPHRRLTGNEAVFSGEVEPVWFVSGETQAALGQTILNPFTVRNVLARLWSLGLTGVLVEGGSRTIRTFWDAGLLDELVLYVAPRVFGAGIDWLPAGKLIGPDHPDLKLVSTTEFEGDIRLHYLAPQA